MKLNLRKSSIPPGEEDKILNDPYIKYISNLNINKINKLRLLAHDADMFVYVDDKYHTLYNDFDSKYPGYNKVLRKYATRKARNNNCIVS